MNSKKYTFDFMFLKYQLNVNHISVSLSFVYITEGNSATEICFYVLL